MLIDDSIEPLDVQVCVPGAFGIYNGDRSLFADPQTIDLVAQHRAIAGRDRDRLNPGFAIPGGRCGGKIEFLKALLEMGPEGAGFLQRGTHRSGLVCTEKDVPLNSRYRQGVSYRFEPFSGIHGHHIGKDTTATANRPTIQNNRSPSEKAPLTGVITHAAMK